MKTIMQKKQLNILIQLATIDSELAGKELKRIEAIAKANGFSDEDIKDLLKKPEPIGSLAALTEDERFEYLYLVIQLMKVDGQVFKSEIAFCQNIAEKLGFKKQVVSELSKNIYGDPKVTADREMLREKIAKYRVAVN